MDIKKILLPCLVTFSIICSAQEESRKISVPEGIEFIQDVNYAGTDNPVQVLDIVIPENRSAEMLPAIVYIHGGGWQGGDKGNAIKTLKPFIGEGDYIGLAINYRLSDETKWPAQIHDCKAAIRWIKGNADKYGIDKERIGVWGTSAGGHLIAMLALTSVTGEFEGTVGNYPEENDLGIQEMQSYVDLSWNGGFISDC